MTINRVLAAVAAATAMLSTAASAECKLTQVGEIPIILKGNRPLVEATVNGQTVLFLLDTGAFFNTMTFEAAKRLQLDSGHENRFQVIGVGGRAEGLRLAQVDELKVGNFLQSKAEFVVVTTELDKDVVGLLGQNMFGKDDVEFDFAHNIVRTFRPTGCEKSPLAYWGSAFALADIDRIGSVSGPIQTDVLVNGKKVWAQFDTGAPVSLVSVEMATRVGQGVDNPAVKPAGTSGGIGKGVVDLWVGQFDSFTLGDESINKTKILIGAWQKNVPTEVPTGTHTRERVMNVPEMYLGTDFFKAHRIYVAHSQRRMYFSYNGGPVFNVGPGDAKP